jgi:hypothetical protein
MLVLLFPTELSISGLRDDFNLVSVDRADFWQDLNLLDLLAAIPNSKFFDAFAKIVERCWWG